MQNEPSGEYYDYTKTMKPERPYRRAYHQSLVYLTMNCTRDGEGKLDTIYMTFEQTLNAIRGVHDLTCGIPQIVYMVGWHHEGHDSKYPDWSEVNRHLKRECDDDALDSLRWLIREARQYNATVSLHLNMFDAYQDSPLWDEYVAKDVIAKDENGNVIPGKEWGGMVSYQTSYTQEWKTGLAQRRIDGIIEMVPELVEGGTIHIDAFIGARPLDREAPISPYLGYTKAEEIATQRKIYRYWRDRGIDVTSEWVNGLRDDRMVGLQAWAWHGGSAVEDLPDELYCSNPMQEARHLGGKWGSMPDKFLEEFCLLVMPWHYRNNPNGTGDPQSMIDDGDVCMPALWCEEPTLIAYSRDGCKDRAWRLPSNWNGVTDLAISRLSVDGPEPLGEIAAVDDTIILSLAPDQAIKITQKANA